MFRASRPLLGPMRAVHCRGGGVLPSSSGSLAGSLGLRPLAGRPARPTRPWLATPTALSLVPRAAASSSSSSSSSASNQRPPVELKIDREHEKKLAEQMLRRHTEDSVTGSSSVSDLLTGTGTDDRRNAPDVSNSLQQDVKSIQEALSLEGVPRQSYMLGLGGTIPYFVTSLATVYLGWDLRHAYPTSSPVANTFLVSHETAQQWLQMLEPIQLGYGALILTFLGAIHWGMEYMETKPEPARTRFRYGMGVLAPAMAWPTLLMPVHFALTGQFLAFVLLYMADSRASQRGWAPPWYGTYRFALTFITGSALLVSILFRAKVDDQGGAQMAERLESGKHAAHADIAEDFTDKWARLEGKEKGKNKKEKEKKEKEEEKAKKEEGEKADGKGAEGNKEDQSEDKGEGKGEGQGEDKPEDKGEDDKAQSNSEGDEKKGTVDGDTSSKKKDAKGDEAAKPADGKDK